jgi:hypothetical protein
MYRNRKECKVCGTFTYRYAKHIMTHHANLVTSNGIEVQKIFGIGKSTSRVVREGLGMLRKRIYTCPRCKEIITKKQEHIEQRHALEFMVAHKNNLSNSEISNMLFGGWCTASMVSKVRSCLKRSYDVEVPIPVAYVCESDDGGVRLMKMGEKGIGVAVTL